jgi:hypothetical protein
MAGVIYQSFTTADGIQRTSAGHSGIRPTSKFLRALQSADDNEVS